MKVIALLLDWSEVRGEAKQNEGLLELFNALEGSEPALARLADGSALVGSGIMIGCTPIAYWCPQHARYEALPTCSWWLEWPGLTLVQLCVGVVQVNVRVGSVRICRFNRSLT